MVDVTVSQMLAASPEQVASVMFDPMRDAEWIGGARSAEWVGEGRAIALGAKVRRTGGFLGRSFSWTTEIEAYEPARRLVMRYLDGPFRGTVTFEIEPASGGARASIRNAAKASFELPGMGLMMKASVGKDLQRLKGLVEPG